MLEILKAEYQDLPRILEIYAFARVKMIENGNPDQWVDGYPKKELLEQDIKEGTLYKVLKDHKIVGAFMLVPGPDEVYTAIQGSWLNEEPYLVIHRIASQGAAGVAGEVFSWVLRQTDSLRIDTHNDNSIMRHVLEKEGFRYVGELTLPNGDARRAYHKINPGEKQK